MDTQSRQELERLYGLALSATATTHFYNALYQYIGFVKQSHFLQHILEEDDNKGDSHHYFAKSMLLSTRTFGHQIGVLFYTFGIHKTLNFSTPGKSDKNKTVQV